MRKELIEVGVNWTSLTDGDSDFTTPPHADGFGSTGTVLVVAKKLPPILQRIDAWIEQLGSRMADLPTLIIDDEADQASINTRGNRRDPSVDADDEANPNEAPTRTNLLIRTILQRIPKATYIAYTIYHANFHAIVNGKAYRSGQMNARQFTRAIQDYGIKSILNLRGENPKDEWYCAETNIAQQFGVQHFDFALSARREVTDEEIEHILSIIRGAPKPILIHCQAGADRSGLVSALYCLTIEGQTPAQADKQLTVWYGHIPLLKTIAMDHSYWHFVRDHTAQADSRF